LRYVYHWSHSRNKEYRMLAEDDLRCPRIMYQMS
jgi:hypothetical protein